MGKTPWAKMPALQPKSHSRKMPFPVQVLLFLSPKLFPVQIWTRNQRWKLRYCLWKLWMDSWTSLISNLYIFSFVHPSKMHEALFLSISDNPGHLEHRIYSQYKHPTRCRLSPALPGGPSTGDSTLHDGYNSKIDALCKKHKNKGSFQYQARDSNFCL